MSVTAEDVKQTYTHLNSPLELGPLGGSSLVTKNRVFMASLTRSRAVPEDVANDTMIEYYRQRAAGGAGLILSEGTLTSPQGTEWPNVASIYSDEHTAGWKKVTEAVHREGGLIIAQLWHVGRVAHPDMPLQAKFGKPVSAPSPIGARGGNFRMLNGAPNVAPEREHPDPWELVEEFHQAAIRAKEAGFDGVEFHGANGYLAAQFLDTNTNHRTDEWGGSLENRTRFYLECLRAICKVWGADRVGMKLNPCGGYNDVGMNEKDTLESYGRVIMEAVKLGLAYIQLVRYLPFMDGEFDGKKRADTHLDVLEAFGPIIHSPTSRTKLLLNGNLTAQEAETLISKGEIDGAVFGRSWISNPDLANRIFKGQELNDQLGFEANPKKFYTFDKNPEEGYTDYPNYEEAKKK